MKDRITIEIAREFSARPKGKFLWQGPASAEAFRRTLLVPALRHYRQVYINLENIEVNVDFLEGVFGGLIRERFDREYLRRHLHLTPASKETYEKLVDLFMDSAVRHAKAPRPSDIYIYVDANILQNSDVGRISWLPEEWSVNWGGNTIKGTSYHRYEVSDKRITIRDRQLLKESLAIQLLARFDQLPTVHFLQQYETQLETKYMPGTSLPLFGARVLSAGNPIPYARALSGHLASSQSEFMERIDHARFRYFQKLVGVQKGMGEKRRGAQLLDAWHLWCAEQNQCAYFLTMDFKLVRMLQNAVNVKPSSQPPTPVRAVKPSELLDELKESVGWARLSWIVLGGMWDIWRTSKGRIYDLAKDGWPPPRS